ncbi:polyhydroxyalkanoate depolymerase [Aurantimonas endophytica]|uniref:Polyhydroxyalkanoate depolymerase n=1 Tax=Aurantimonas endophytica TaxID=1522175 RepID=A0A7W6MRQ2_9HYPH|nr:polyhydroxyalkanoate depolymerase [Aurantimonas endophytica]MBB4005224.1 polyhydroxyalkanoate depolymerase [Aurantimonas endophytica]MCO6406113.1 polyhydroxyalkanoate depolymerase [Aurantimonas endophytica]
MLYHLYEMNHAALVPLRAVADATRLFYQHPLNPMSHTHAGRSIAAAAEVFERNTRVYAKPEFGLYETVVAGQRVPVQDKVVWEKPFGRLLHFERALPPRHGKDPRILIVAPMSGHYATLLRGTVEALLPYADVYITDWTDARKVPITEGRFDLDDYVDYLIEMLRFLGPDTHVVGVCQPAVPVIMATALMEAEEDPCAPATMTLMGGPIDTRENPTAVNRLAQEKGIDWFREKVIMPVPFPQPGFMRPVYPGFLQLTGFMSMNLDRHMTAHKEFFWHLVKDDGDSADKHRGFYDEYNAVMDLTAEFYLQTVEEVFIKHSLPKGEMMHRGKRVDLKAIRRTALLTVEGENDDISGVGQTKAAQKLCINITEDKRVHYMQPKVGHYGVFNGSRFRAEIAPRIVDFALTHGTTHAAASLPRKAAAPKTENLKPEALATPIESATSAKAAEKPAAATAAPAEAKKPVAPAKPAAKAKPAARSKPAAKAGPATTSEDAKPAAKSARAPAKPKADKPAAAAAQGEPPRRADNDQPASAPEASPVPAAPAAPETPAKSAARPKAAASRAPQKKERRKPVAPQGPQKLRMVTAASPKSPTRAAAVSAASTVKSAGDAASAPGPANAEATPAAPAKAKVARVSRKATADAAKKGKTGTRQNRRTPRAGKRTLSSRR